MEDKVNCQVRKKIIISNAEFTNLYVSGPSLSIMYGSPKIHKEEI